MPAGFPDLAVDFVAAVKAQAVAQAPDVLSEYARHHVKPGTMPPENVIRVGCVTQALGIPSVTNRVNSDILGVQFSMSAHFLLDQSKSSANVHVPMLMSQGYNLAAVDPDRHHKNPALVTLAEAAPWMLSRHQPTLLPASAALGLK